MSDAMSERTFRADEPVAIEFTVDDGRDVSTARLVRHADGLEFRIFVDQEILPDHLALLEILKRDGYRTNRGAVSDATALLAELGYERKYQE